MKRKLKVDINKINAMRNIKSTMALSTSMVLATSAIAPTIALANTADMVATGQEVAFDESDYVAYEYVVEEGEYYALEEDAPVIGPGGAAGSAGGGFVIPEGLTEEDYLITDGEYNEDDYGIDTVWHHPVDVSEPAATWEQHSGKDTDYADTPGSDYADGGASGNDYTVRHVIYDIKKGTTPLPEASGEISVSDGAMTIDGLGISIDLYFVGHDEDDGNQYTAFEIINPVGYEATLVSGASYGTDFASGENVYIKFEFGTEGSNKYTGTEYFDTGYIIGAPDLTSGDIKLTNSTDASTNKVEFKGDSTASVAAGNVELYLNDTKTDISGSVYTTEIVLPKSATGDYIVDGTGYVFVYLYAEGEPKDDDFETDGVTNNSNENYAKGTFTITGYDLNNSRTAVKMLDSENKEITEVTFTGNAIKPDIEVKYGSATLVEGTDYETLTDASYKNNTNVASASDASAPTITITGKGNYSGTYEHKFDIVENSGQYADSSKYTVTNANTTLNYTGSALEQNPTITFTELDGTTKTIMTKNVDYTLSYYKSVAGTYGTTPVDVIDAGSYKVGVTPIGKYAAKNDDGSAFIFYPRTGFFKVEADISSISLYPTKESSPSSVSDASYDFEYVASGTQPGIFGVDSSNNVVSTTYYTVGKATGDDNKVGPSKVTVNGRTDNGYSGSTDVAFNITAQPLTNASENIILKDSTGTKETSFSFTGEAIKFDGTSGTMEVKNKEGDVLVEGTDYTVAYNNNTAVGTSAAVIVTGMGNYSGNIQKTFSIGAGSSSSLDCEIGTIKDIIWTGEAVEPTAFDIKVGGSTINVDPAKKTDDTDFDWDITYDTAVTDAGTHKIKSITGSATNPDYSGVAFNIASGGDFNVVYDMVNDATYTILGTDVETATTCTFTGAALKPKIKVTIAAMDSTKNKVITADATGTDGLKVTYGENINAGTDAGSYTIVPTDSSDVKFGAGYEVSNDFDITANAITAVTAVVPKGADGNATDGWTFKYTGAAINPEVTKITLTPTIGLDSKYTPVQEIGIEGNDGYVKGDYKVSWSDNIDIDADAVASFATGTNGNITFSSVTFEDVFTIVSDDALFEGLLDDIVPDEVYFNGSDVSLVAADAWYREYAKLDTIVAPGQTVAGDGFGITYQNHNKPGWASVTMTDSKNADINTSKSFKLITDITEDEAVFFSVGAATEAGEKSVEDITNSDADTTKLGTGAALDTPQFYYQGGTAIEPKVHMMYTKGATDKATWITPVDSDGYSVTYQGNTGVGTGYMTVTGVGEFYTGSHSYIPFDVVATPIATETSGSDATPLLNSAITLNIVDDEGAVLSGGDSNVAYVPNTAPLVVEYTGSAININDKIELKHGDYDLVYGKDYKIEYNDLVTDVVDVSSTNNDLDIATAAGQAKAPTATIVGMGGYLDSDDSVDLPIYFSIEAVEVDADDVTIADQAYTGVAFADTDFVDTTVSDAHTAPDIEIKVNVNGKTETLKFSSTGTDAGTGDFYIDTDADLGTDPGTGTLTLLATTAGAKKYDFGDDGIDVDFNIVADLSEATIEVGGEEYDAIKGATLSYGTTLDNNALNIYFSTTTTSTTEGVPDTVTKNGTVNLNDTNTVNVSWTRTDGKTDLNAVGTARATIQSALGATTYINSATVDVEVKAADFTSIEKVDEVVDSGGTVTTEGVAAKTYITFDSNSLSNKMYTGSEIKADNLVVKYFPGGNATPTGSSTTFLTEGVDYTVTYANNTEVSRTLDAAGAETTLVDADKASITIKGINNYEGEFTDYFTITENEADKLAGFTVSEIADQTYTGSAIEPALTVKIGEKTLAKGTDYEIVYYDGNGAAVEAGHIEPGLDYDAKVEGLGSYSGMDKKEITFNIVGNLADTKALLGTITPKYYDEVDIKTDDNVATAKVYTDYYNLATKTDTSTDKNGLAAFAGADGGYELVYVSGSTTANGTSKWTLQPKLNEAGKSAFTGTRSVSISTVAVSLADEDNLKYTAGTVNSAGTGYDSAEGNDGRLKLSLDATTLFENGSLVKPTVVSITDTGRKDADGTTDYKLVEGTDFTVSYTNKGASPNIKDDTVEVKITGKGSYTGSYTATVKVLENTGAYSFSKTLSTAKNLSYTGSDLTPSYTIYSEGGVKLEEYTHYTVTENGRYKSPTYNTTTSEWNYGTIGTDNDANDLTSPGWHSVTITGINNSSDPNVDDFAGATITLNYLVTTALSNSKLSFAIADTEAPSTAFKDENDAITGLVLKASDTPTPELLLTATYTNGDTKSNFVDLTADDPVADLQKMLKFTPSTSTDHSSVRSHSVTITPQDNTPWFTGSKTVSYNIVNKLINSSTNVTGMVVGAADDTSFDQDTELTVAAEIYSTKSQSFTGSALKPEVTLTGLTLDKDYTVSYSNNTNVFTLSTVDNGTGESKKDGSSDYTTFATAIDGSEKVPCITITGKGDYSGTIKYYFQIEGLGSTTDIDNGDFSLSKDTEVDNITKVAAQQTYTGNAVTPTSTVYYEGKSLSSSYITRYYFTEEEYEAGKSDMTALKAKYDAGTADKTILPGKHIMYVEGAGNYTGLSQTFEYDIAISLSNSKISWVYDKDTTKSYNGLVDSAADRPVTATIPDPAGESGDVITIFTNDEDKADVNLYKLDISYDDTKDKGTAKIVVKPADANSYFLTGSSKSLSYTITGSMFTSDFNGTIDSDTGKHGDDGTKGFKIEVLETGEDSEEYYDKEDYSSAEFAADNTLAYTGSALKPELRITDIKLTADAGAPVYVNPDDYTITYINNTNVGKASMVITGKNNYASVLSHDFIIKNEAATTDGNYFTFGSRNYHNEEDGEAEYGDKLNDNAVSGDIFLANSGIIADQTLAYSSKATVASTPTLTIKFYNADTGKNTTLKQNTDYTISYKNNGTPGLATATITGIGNYTALNQDIQFNVKGNLSVASAVIDTESISEIYFARKDEEKGYVFETGKSTETSNGLEGLLTFLNATGTKDGSGNDYTTVSETLVNNTDYTVGYTNNEKSGTCTITFTAKTDGNYTGSTKTTFKILANDLDANEGKYLSNLTGTMSKPSGVDYGTITSDGTSITPPTSDPSVTVNYLSDSTTSSTAKYQYTGSEIKPTLKLSYVNPDGVTTNLIEDTDYTLSYSNNTAISTSDKKGTITITGKNGFTGTKIYAYFDIVPNPEGVIIDSSLYAISSPTASSRGAVSVSPSVYGLVNDKWTKLTNNTHYTLKYTEGADPNSAEMSLTSGRKAGDTVYVHAFGANMYYSNNSTDDNYSTTSFTIK